VTVTATVPLGVLARTTIDEASAAIKDAPSIAPDQLQDRELVAYAVDHHAGGSRVDELLHELRMVERREHPARYRSREEPPPLTKKQRKAAKRGRRSRVPTFTGPWTLAEIFDARDRLLDEYTDVEFLWRVAGSKDDPLPYEIERDEGQAAVGREAAQEAPERAVRAPDPPGDIHNDVTKLVERPPLIEKAKKRRRRRDPSGVQIQIDHGLATRTSFTRIKVGRADDDWNLDAAAAFHDNSSTIEQHAAVVQVGVDVHVTDRTGRPPGRPRTGTADVENAGRLIMERLPADTTVDQARACMKHRGRRTPEQHTLSEQIVEVVGDLHAQKRAGVDVMASFLGVRRQSLHKKINRHHE
jgi:hypothetical protein